MLAGSAPQETTIVVTRIVIIIMITKIRLIETLALRFRAQYLGRWGFGPEDLCGKQNEVRTAVSGTYFMTDSSAPGSVTLGLPS